MTPRRAYDLMDWYLGIPTWPEGELNLPDYDVILRAEDVQIQPRQLRMVWSDDGTEPNAPLEW